jgi:hypothetical protein
MINILHNLALLRVKNAIFANLFDEKISKIITLVSRQSDKMSL